MRVFVYGYDNRCDFSQTYGVASTLELAKEKALEKYTEDAQMWDMYKGKSFRLNPEGVFESQYSDVVTVDEICVDGITINSKQFEVRVNEN